MNCSARSLIVNWKSDASLFRDSAWLDDVWLQYNEKSICGDVETAASRNRGVNYWAIEGENEKQQRLRSIFWPWTEWRDGMKKNMWVKMEPKVSFCHSRLSILLLARASFFSFAEPSKLNGHLLMAPAWIITILMPVIASSGLFLFVKFPWKCAFYITVVCLCFAIAPFHVPSLAMIVGNCNKFVPYGEWWCVCIIIISN